MKAVGTRTAIALGLAAVLVGRPAPAQAPPRALDVTAQNLSARTAGRTADVLPGDTVRYELRFTNQQPGTVRNVVFDNPVPAGMRYIAQSATADRQNTSVSYSIDGGRTYSAEPTMQRVENGRRVVVPAPPELYTHIRWTVQGDLLPGARVTAEFRVQLPPRSQDSSAHQSRGA